MRQSTQARVGYLKYYCKRDHQASLYSVQILFYWLKSYSIIPSIYCKKSITSYALPTCPEKTSRQHDHGMQDVQMLMSHFWCMKQCHHHRSRCVPPLFISGGWLTIMLLSGSSTQIQPGHTDFPALCRHVRLTHRPQYLAELQLWTSHMYSLLLSTYTHLSSGSFGLTPRINLEKWDGR